VSAYSLEQAAEGAVTLGKIRPQVQRDSAGAQGARGVPGSAVAIGEIEVKSRDARTHHECLQRPFEGMHGISVFSVEHSDRVLRERASVVVLDRGLSNGRAIVNSVGSGTFSGIHG
jgi:hypothetical protein